MDSGHSIEGPRTGWHLGFSRRRFSGGNGYLRFVAWRFALTFSWARRGRRMAR